MSDADNQFFRRAVLQSLPWTGLLIGLLVLVQSRSIVAIDTWLLGLVVATRPFGLADLMNWVFRLGFAQIDLAVALGWSSWILVSRRSLGEALPPLLIGVVIAVEVGLRLVIDQPQPGPEYAVSLKAPANSVASVLDRGDESVRTSFEAATFPISSSPRGSFPSGHASRTMFLALWAIWSLGQARETPAGVERRERRGNGSNRRWRPWRTPGLVPIGIVAGALFPIVVSYSALFFGYHWPSDIIAGFLLAIAVFPIARWIQQTIPSTAGRTRLGG